MRTVLFLAAGILLMGGLLLLGKLFTGQYWVRARGNVLIHCCVVAAVNMWLGVTRAGYSVAEELPISLLIFGVPVALAGIIKWQFL